MSCFRIDLRAAAAAALLLLAGAAAKAADMPDFDSRFVGQQPVNWEGVVVGATVGYGNLNTDFADSSDPFGGVSSTSSRQIGGFIGYNAQWDELVLGAEGAYNRPSGWSGGSQTGLSTITLTDDATVRVRAGYAVGQFLPYGFLGVAVARMNYTTPGSSRSDAFTAGGAAGLGVDVIVLPNVFLRAEWEYDVFATFGGIRTSTNTGRVGVGLRF
jgi:hypothetical protein